MTRSLRSIFHFVWDWRTVITIVAAVVSGLLMASTIRGYTDNANLRSLNRIQRDTLQAKIDKLVAEEDQAAQERGQLRAQVEALSEQLRQMGAKPVVVSTTTTTTTTTPKKQPRQSPQSPSNNSPGTTTPQNPPPSTPPTTQPPPPDKHLIGCIEHICI